MSDPTVSIIVWLILWTVGGGLIAWFAFIAGWLSIIASIADDSKLLFNWGLGCWIFCIGWTFVSVWNVVGFAIKLGEVLT